jgi:hypothetical protein
MHYVFWDAFSPALEYSDLKEQVESGKDVRCYFSLRKYPSVFEQFMEIMVVTVDERLSEVIHKLEKGHPAEYFNLSDPVHKIYFCSFPQFFEFFKAYTAYMGHPFKFNPDKPDWRSEMDFCVKYVKEHCTEL